MLWDPNSSQNPNGSVEVAHYDPLANSITVHGHLGSQVVDGSTSFTRDNFAHEIGHSLGLGHDSCPNGIMADNITDVPDPGLTITPAECMLAGDPRCPGVGWVATFDSTRFANGAHTLTVTATDAMGLQATLQRGLVIANTVPPPVVAITAPASGGLVRGAVLVQATATGASLSRVDLSEDGVLVGSDVTAPYLYSWSSTTVPDGLHTLQAKAYQAAGQAATSPPIALVVDNTLPSLFVAQPATGAMLSGTAVKVAGWATDTNRVVSLAFLVDGQVVATPGGVAWLNRSDVCASVATSDPDCPNVGWRAFFDSSQFANGAHTLMVIAMDAAGNQSSSATVVTTSNSLKRDR